MMTEQEFYIHLLNRNSSSSIILSNFNPDFLKNYEIAKLVLDKFGLERLDKNQCKSINQQAIFDWFRTSEFIHLKYDIPEVLDLLPDEIGGDVSLSFSNIECLPNLRVARRRLDLFSSRIKSLPKLEFVGGTLNLTNSRIEFLPELHTINKRLILKNSKIASLPKLEKVELCMVDYQCVSYWRNYFENSGKKYISDMVTI